MYNQGVHWGIKDHSFVACLHCEGTELNVLCGGNIYFWVSLPTTETATVGLWVGTEWGSIKREQILNIT